MWETHASGLGPVNFKHSTLKFTSRDIRRQTGVVPKQRQSLQNIIQTLDKTTTNKYPGDGIHQVHAPHPYVSVGMGYNKIETSHGRAVVKATGREPEITNS